MVRQGGSALCTRTGGPRREAGGAAWHAHARPRGSRLAHPRQLSIERRRARAPPRARRTHHFEQLRDDEADERHHERRAGRQGVPPARRAAGAAERSVSDTARAGGLAPRTRAARGAHPAAATWCCATSSPMSPHAGSPRGPPRTAAPNKNKKEQASPAGAGLWPLGASWRSLVHQGWCVAQAEAMTDRSRRPNHPRPRRRVSVTALKWAPGAAKSPRAKTEDAEARLRQSLLVCFALRARGRPNTKIHAF